jgi:hypothetical protein
MPLESGTLTLDGSESGEELSARVPRGGRDDAWPQGARRVRIGQCRGLWMQLFLKEGGLS